MNTMDLNNEHSVNLQSVDMDLTCTTSPVQQIEPQTMKVYLRVRPFSKEELSDHEDQGCVVIDNSRTVTLNAPKGSAAMKSSEKGIGTSVHKFSFSQVFGPEMTQSELFEATVRSQTSDFLDGKNALIFSYGVTNAGKTYTIQGTPKDPGILPRALEATFQFIGGCRYDSMDLKPHLRDDAQHLDPDQVRLEKNAKAAIFASVKEECDPPRAESPSNTTSCFSYNQTALASDPTDAGSSRFALWVAFFEIYNECVYDLLQHSLCSKSKKRAALRVCDDGAGNAYVRDLRWINVSSLSEANKVLQFGNKNRSAAATKMNHSSSRSHSIFTMKLLKVDGSSVKRISEYGFSLCDLAGSERCNKTKTFGERLKEAGNINNSLLILGKCITALRNNQTDRLRSSSVPFRESKLTKLFQAVFCGKGKASMIVNINQCSSTYDETLYVMKFSAVAKQVLQVVPDRAVDSPGVVGPDGKRLVDVNQREDELLDEEDEEDVSVLPQNELLTVIENLRTKLLAERKRNLKQEMEIRKEMGDAMLQQLMESDELHNRQIKEMKETYQEKLENTFEMYKDAIKEHAFQCARSELEDDYVPLDEFLAEQDKVEALKRKLSTLQTSSTGGGQRPRLTVDQSCQTLPYTAAGDDGYIRLYKEKCALETMCEEKQQLIVSLESRLMDVSKTLQTVSDGFLDKSAHLEALQNKADDQEKSLADLHQQIFDRDQEVATLKAELSRLTQRSPVEARPKRGLLANLREAVTSPRSAAAARTLRKTSKPRHV